MILSKIKVAIIGSNRTRLINKLKNENIPIYYLKTDESATFWVKQNDLKKLKEFADLYGVQLEVVKTSGVAGSLEKIIKNLPYIAAVIICFVMLIISTQYVYNVKVEAQNDVYANKVELLLRENNIFGTIPKGKINLNEVENLILSNLSEVSFATCYIEGFSLKIKIVANDNPKQTEEKKNLHSDFDAVVTRIMVRSGTGEVAVGQRVKAGDVLIGGYHIADNTPSDGEENGDIIEVVADGEVYGKVYTHKRFVIPEQAYTFVKTGKSKIKRQIGFNKLAVIKSGKVPYEFYEVATTNIKLFGLLPLNITTYEYFELQKVQIEQNTYIENLKNKCDSEFIASLNLDAKLLVKNYEIKEVEGIKYLYIFYETEQRIDNGGY